MDSRSYHRRVGLRYTIRPKTCDVNSVTILKQKRKRNKWASEEIDYIGSGEGESMVRGMIAVERKGTLLRNE